MVSEVFSLQGKNVLITGASSGIGAATARVCAEHGAHVVLVGRNEERANSVLESLSGEGHKVVIADLTDKESIHQLVDHLDLLDGIVHSAGVTAHMPARFIRPKNIDAIFKINYEAVVLLTARILAKKKMNAGGSMVFLSSIATKYTYFGGALYSGSKAALEAYSKTLAGELSPKKIRCNCLKPSFVKGPMVAEAGKTISDEVLQNFEKMMPLGFGEPEDVANTIAFFLSDAAKWITGTELILGGG